MVTVPLRPAALRRRQHALRRLAGLAAALAGGIAGLAAQTVTLDTFDSGSSSGAVIASPLPTSWVNQVTFAPTTITVGGSALDDNGWGANGLSLDVSAATYLRISGRLDPGHSAPTLAIQLLDANLNAVVFSVSSAAFVTDTLSFVQIPIANWDAGFDPSRLSSWTIGGGTTGFVPFRMTLDHLALSASPLPLTGGGRIVTAGAQSYPAAIALDAATTLVGTGSNGNAISFGSTVDGAHALVLSTPGATTLTGAVGHTTPLASLSTDSGGTTTIAGGKVFTSGNQTYGDAVHLGATTHLKSTLGSVSFSNSLHGHGHSLTLEVAQASSLAGANSLGTLIKSGAGTLTLTGASTDIGHVRIEAGTLALGVAHALPTTTALTLAGGVFATGGHEQTLGALAVSGAATIDFGHGAGTVSFAASHSLAWSGTLTVFNFTTGVDALRFGLDAAGLSVDQLARIDFGPGFTATIDAGGYVVGVSAIPEPAMSALLAGSALLGFALHRRLRRPRVSTTE
jgi:autotransporter-associated beta strand protein